MNQPVITKTTGTMLEIVLPLNIAYTTLSAYMRDELGVQTYRLMGSFQPDAPGTLGFTVFVEGLV